MTVEAMRDKISRVYDGPKWKYKVRNMPRRQVIAIYYSMLEKGTFNKPDVKKNLTGPEYIQMTIWDLPKGEN